jgi:hypothetical protein
MRERLVFWIVGVACVCATVFYGIHKVAASEPVSFRAFTATVHETKFNHEGVARDQESHTVAFRSDGSSASDRHHTLPNGEDTEVRVVTDVHGGRQVVVDYATESTSTYPVDSSYATLLAKQADNCKVAPRSSETILGYDVVLVHAGNKYGNGMSNVHDRWEAPALDCFALRTLDFATRSPGTPAPHNEAEVTNILLGEPDSSLFAIPQHFVERSPSQRHAEFHRRFGLEAPTPKEADDIYFAAHKGLR